MFRLCTAYRQKNIDLRLSRFEVYLRHNMGQFFRQNMHIFELNMTDFVTNSIDILTFSP